MFSWLDIRVLRRWRGQVGEEDKCETWSGDWDCTCVVGNLAVDGDYRCNDRWLKSHKLESERIVNYFVRERICFCIHQTRPCNTVSIRNRSAYLNKRSINERTNRKKQHNILDLHALPVFHSTLVQSLVNHSYLSDYHAWNQSSQLWKVHPVHRSYKQVWGHCFHRWFGMCLLYRMLLLRRMLE